MFENLSAFPNPASEFFTIQIENQSEYTLQLFDILGNELRVMKGRNNEILVPVAQLQSGIYIYSLSSDGQKHSGRIVVDR